MTTFGVIKDFLSFGIDLELICTGSGIYCKKDSFKMYFLLF